MCYCANVKRVRGDGQKGGGRRRGGRGKNEEAGKKRGEEGEDSGGGGKDEVTKKHDGREKEEQEVGKEVDPAGRFLEAFRIGSSKALCIFLLFLSLLLSKDSYTLTRIGLICVILLFVTGPSKPAWKLHLLFLSASVVPLDQFGRTQ